MRVSASNETISIPIDFVEKLKAQVVSQTILHGALQKAHTIQVENNMLCMYFYDDFQEIWINQESTALKTAIAVLLGRSIPWKVILEKEPLPQEALAPPTDQIDMFRRIFKGEIQGAK